MRELRIYKPKSGKDGAAASFQISLKKDEFKTKDGRTIEKKVPWLFLNLAKQGADKGGNNTFGWDAEDKICVILSELDAAKFLLVLFGIEKGLGQKDANGKYKGLFHDPNKNENAKEDTKGMNKVIHFNKNDNGGYSLSVSVKQGENRNEIRVPLDAAEGTLLRVYLNGFIEKYYLGD
jgi:hypothetical protein